jgi:hypothetical protein
MTKRAFKIHICCRECGGSPVQLQERHQIKPVIDGVKIGGFVEVAPSIVTATCTAGHTWELEGIHSLEEVIEIPEPAEDDKSAATNHASTGE